MMDSNLYPALNGTEARLDVVIALLREMLAERQTRAASEDAPAAAPATRKAARK